MRNTVPAVLALAALVWAAPLTHPAIAKDEAPKAVAKVNGKLITERDVAIAERELGPVLDSANVQDPGQRRQIIVAFLVDNQLMAEAGEKENMADGAACGDIFPTTPDWTANQNYLGPAPDGLDSGRNCVTATIYRSSESPESARDVTWCFEVT